MLAKRKRSSDAVSDAGTSHTDHTEASTPRGHIDEKTQLLAEKREHHAAAKLTLEEQILQVQEQKQHVAAQLEQLEGCEGGRDALGVSDLKAQLQDYEDREQHALAELTRLDVQFEAAVAQTLGIPIERQSSQLAAALLKQQRLQEAQVQQLAVEQQMAGSVFAVTDNEKRQAKKARLERISQVWDWLQDSSAAGSGETTATATDQQHQRQQQQDEGQRPAGNQQQQQQQQGEDSGQTEHNGQQQQHGDALGHISEEAGEPRVLQAQQQQDKQAASPPQAAAPGGATAAASAGSDHVKSPKHHDKAARGRSEVCEGLAL